MSTRIRFTTSNRSTFLSQLRERTTFHGRRRMNRKLGKLFAKAGVAMKGQVWTDAQAAYVQGGKAAASKVLARYAK